MPLLLVEEACPSSYSQLCATERVANMRLTLEAITFLGLNLNQSSFCALHPRPLLEFLSVLAVGPHASVAGAPHQQDLVAPAGEGVQDFATQL